MGFIGHPPDPESNFSFILVHSLDANKKSFGAKNLRSPDFFMRQKRLDDFLTAAKLILWVDVRGEALLPLDKR